MLILPQTTLAAGPQISNVVVDPNSITATAATIFWITNTTSNSVVRYGVVTPPTQVASDSDTVTTHFVHLTGLTPNTTYHFEVESTDGSGTSVDNNGGAFYSFTTLSVAEYSIALDHACGVCGDLIEAGVCGEIIGVTAEVAAGGTYHICWDSRAQANAVATFTVSGAGSHTLTFFMPEATQGLHNVYLTDAAYAERASTQFEVFPSVKITPEEGPVDTEVTLNGYGFAASQRIRVTLVQGEVGTGEQKTATANAVGSWTMPYTIPHTPAGSYTFEIEAEEGTVWVNWVSKYFEILPGITVTPTSGTVGQAITVTGTGFASEEENVQVTFDGEVRKEDIFADADGSWTASITVPVHPIGRYVIDASGSVTRARDVQDVTFTLVAGISVGPPSGYVGDTITVAGGGFAAGEAGIRISFDGAVAPAPTITADTYGCWESSFALPASAYGSHTVSASGGTTAAVTDTVTTLARIVEFSPIEGAPGDSVSLTGNGFHGSQALRVTVGGIAASGDMRSQANGNVAISFRVPAGSIAGQRTLVVTDDSGATDSVDFTVTTKTLSITPLPISPRDSTLRSGMVTFRWQGSTGSTDYTYTLEIRGEGSTWSKSIEESTYALTKDEELGPGTYQWRVRIVDDYGNVGPWSDPVEFRVSPIPIWVWIVVGVVVLVVLLAVAYRETKFRVTE